MHQGVLTHSLYHLKLVQAARNPFLVLPMVWRQWCWSSGSWLLGRVPSLQYNVRTQTGCFKCHIHVVHATSSVHVLTALFVGLPDGHTDHGHPSGVPHWDRQAGEAVGACCHGCLSCCDRALHSSLLFWPIAWEAALLHRSRLFSWRSLPTNGMVVD